MSSPEPQQEQSQNTWSLAVEDTFHATPAVDVVGGVSYDRYEITKAERSRRPWFVRVSERADPMRSTGRAAVIWRYTTAAELHASVSDRARFPVIFELYSTRFGTATPNPDLGPERATNLEFGWKGQRRGTCASRRRVLQRRPGPDSDGRTARHHDADPERRRRPILRGRSWRRRHRWLQLTFGGNYTALSRTIRDALHPNLRPTGVPTHKAFLYASWRPFERLTITPSMDVAGDRWSDVNPAPAFPYVRTGWYTLIDLAAQYAITSDSTWCSAEKPGRPGLPAGLGVSATWSNVLRQDSNRPLMACEGRAS